MNTRVGIIGAESAHVNHFLRYFRSGRAPGWVVEAVADTDRAMLEPLRDEYEVETTTDYLDLVDRVDAVLVCGRDGRDHFAYAEPFLRRGVDVFLNKPVTTEPEQIAALGDIAAASGAVLEGGTALRFAPDFRRAAQKGVPRSVTVTGPADASSPYAGLHFYGSHHTGLVSLLLGDPVSPNIDVGALAVGPPEGRSHVVAGQIEACHVTLVFTHPDRTSSFHARVSTPAGEVDCSTGPSAPLYVAQMEDFTWACSQRRAVDRGSLVAPVAIMQQVVNQLP